MTNHTHCYPVSIVGSGTGYVIGQNLTVRTVPSNGISRSVASAAYSAD